MRLVALKLEGDLQLRAVTLDFPIVQDHVELGNLGYAKIAQTFRRALDRCRRGLFPALRAGTDQLDHLVNAFRHLIPLH